MARAVIALVGIAKDTNMHGTIFPLLIILLVLMGTWAVFLLIRHEWHRRGGLVGASHFDPVTRFPLLNTARVVLLLATASTLLSALIAALLSFREASQHDPSVASLAIHQFLWSLPCAATYALAIYLLATRMRFKAFVRRISVLTALLVVASFLAPAGPLGDLINGVWHLLFGVVPLSVISSLDSIRISLGPAGSVAAPSFPPALNLTLAAAAGAIVVFMSVCEATLRSGRATRG